MTIPERKAMKALYAAVEKIALADEHAPPPGEYARIKMQWRSMVRAAQKAKEVADRAM